jgi:hypothetical protein
LILLHTLYESIKMVELVEVEDESFETKQVGPSDEDEYTDTGMSHCAAFQGSN